MYKTAGESIMENKDKITHFDAVSMLESENFRILDYIEQLKGLSLKLKKESPDAGLIGQIKSLEETISREVIQYNHLEEEILFPELEWVLPFPSSTESFREEHRQILNLLSLIKDLFEDEEKVLSRTEELQSLILALYNLLERDIRKKNEILFYEAQSMLSQDTLDLIYDKLKHRTK